MNKLMRTETKLKRKAFILKLRMASLIILDFILIKIKLLIIQGFKYLFLTKLFDKSEKEKKKLIMQ